MAAEIKIVWERQPRQITFLRACGLSHPFDGGDPRPPVAAVIGYGGSAGGGKTDALLMAGIIGGLSYPGINVGFFRREYPDLEGPGGAIMRSQELMSGWARWNGQLRRWTLPTGSILQFCHCKTETDVYGYQSQQFDILLIDEATQFTRFMVRYLLTRNRATRPGVIPFAAFATNPGNIGHGWFKTEFIDPGPPERVYEVEVEPGVFEKHIFIPSRLSDNRVLERRDPGYRKRLEAQPEDVRRALLDGDWDVFSGQVFKEFRRNIHVVEPFPIPAEWLRFRAMDWGYARPFSIGWYAVDYDGRLWRYREWYGWNGQPDVGCQMEAREVAEEIKRIEREAGETIAYGVADPSIWAKQGHTGPSIAEEFISRGVYFVPADNDRLQGKMQVHARLKVVDGKPGLYVFSTCVHFIRTIPALVYDKARPEDVDSKGEDHVYDEVRYACMSRPWTPPEPVDKKELPWPLREDRKQEGYLEW